MLIWAKDWALHFFSSGLLGALAYYSTRIIWSRVCLKANYQDRETGRVGTVARRILAVSLLALWYSSWGAHIWQDYVLRLW